MYASRSGNMNNNKTKFQSIHSGLCKQSMLLQLSTLEAFKCFCVNHGEQSFFQFEIL